MKKNTTINLLQSPQEKNSRRWIVGVFTLTLFFSLFSGGSWGQMNNSNALNKDAKTISSSQPISRKASKVSESLNQSQSEKELWKNETFASYRTDNEISERRSANEKHFQREDGQVDMFVSSEPINYIENGLWQTIYNTISEDLTSPYKYSNTSNLFKSYYPEQIQQGFKTILEGKVVLEMQNASMYYQSNGEILGEVSISNSIAKVDKNIISYPSVYGNGIDLLITQKGGKRKLDYIIQNKAALNTQFMNAEYLVFSEDIVLPNGWSAKLENGSVLLMDQTGKVVSLYETPFVFDNNKSVLDKPHNENVNLDLTNFSVERINKDNSVKQIDDNISYEISMNGSTLNILTKVKMTYLKDENRIFPVVVDPTLVSTSAVSGYYFSFQVPYGPAGITTVGAPVGSAINNVNLSFNIPFNGNLIWLGAWYSYTGNCASWHNYSLDDGVTGTFSCGGNLTNWNCQNPNKTWYTEIWSWDGDLYAGAWGYTVTVTYEVNNPGAISVPASICQGTPTNISNVTAASGVGTANYYFYYRGGPANVGWTMYNGPTTSTSVALPAAVINTPGTWYVARNSDFGCGQANNATTVDIPIIVDAAPTLGTLSNPGPIDFCDAGGNFTTAVNVSGQVGSVMWDWGSNNGVWNNNWLAGANSGICCFPKKVSNSDGNADRIRYRVTNGSCSAVTSGTILIRNRFNEAPTNLTSTSSVYCSNAAPATITLTASFPTSINMNGTVNFYSGSCGGTLVGSVSPSASSSSAALTITSPGTTTTYYARYEPGSGFGCSNSACVSTTVTVNTVSIAPVSIIGTTTICAGGSTTLTLSGGTAGTGAVAEWFSGSCGGTLIGTGNSVSVSPGATTTYYVRYSGTCNITACASVNVTVNTLSTALTITPMVGTICPNTNYTIIAGGGTAGAGSQIEWWTGPNGTGTNLGTGSSANVSPSTSTTYYVRRSGTCNTTVDATINVNVKSFIYAANNTSSTGYCTDNAGWNHFFNGNNIIFSVQGDLSGLPVGFPIASIFDNGTYFSESQFPSGGAGCASNQNPGEQRFEMERAWDLNFGGGTPSGTYSVRFYHETVERQAVETAAANYMTAYPSCGYSYLYGAAQFATNGFYLFKNTGSAYSAPDYDGLHLQSLTGTTANGINYAQMSGVTSFSGGSGAIILAPISALPVELISFTANCNETGDKVNVNWSTASEHNTSYFVVEKSRDGLNWTILNTIGAAGNSITVIEYAFTDNDAASGTTYYRLTQFDNDGVFETFNIASVNCGAQQAITSNLVTYPNPSNGSFYVDFYTQDITGPSQISVFDARGVIIYRQEVLVEKGSNVFHIEDLEAAPGMYYIKVSNGTTTSYIVKHSLR